MIFFSSHPIRKLLCSVAWEVVVGRSEHVEVQASPNVTVSSVSVSKRLYETNVYVYAKFVTTQTSTVPAVFCPCIVAGLISGYDYLLCIKHIFWLTLITVQCLAKNLKRQTYMMVLTHINCIYLGNGSVGFISAWLWWSIAREQLSVSPFLVLNLHKAPGWPSDMQVKTSHAPADQSRLYGQLRFFLKKD